MKSTIGFKESFATGYPFCVLEEGLNGDLPVINEQIRYNDELAFNASKSDKKYWVCADCMEKNYFNMPDLKILYNHVQYER